METLLGNYPGIGMVAFLIFCYVLVTRIGVGVGVLNRKRKLAPQVSGGLPLVGHLRLLGGSNSKPAHITLGNLADKYGPIFTMKLGIHPTLVVSNWQIAKECFTTNDRAFANRSRVVCGEILAFNYAMFGFAPYGPYWRHIRKIASLELLSSKRLDQLKHIRESEIKRAIQQLYQQRPINNSSAMSVGMNKWFWTMIINTIFKMVVGKRYSDLEGSDIEGKDDGLRNAMRDFFNLAGAFSLADWVPFLRWFDLGGHEKAMKKVAKQMDQIFGEWLEEHKQQQQKKKNEGQHDDFMGIMLSLLKDDEQLSTYDVDRINKATCLAIILGSSDPTTAAMIWALSLLLNHRDVLRKAQQELDTHVGKERMVQESDMNKLVYLQAIIKESMRLYPAAPLGGPRETIQDCTAGGYFIPAGTRLLVNISKLQRDPTVWSDADEFRPERFVTTHKNFDVKGNNYQLIPFGSGRRICPGISFAMQVLPLTLASVLQAFDITTPSDEPVVDMREGAGLTNLKATPLKVLLTPRLPPHLYQ